MKGWIIAEKLLHLASQLPIERLVAKPDYTKSEQLLAELKAKAATIAISSHITQSSSQASPPEPTQASSPEYTLEEIIEREREGDYCVSCIPAKHLMRVKDALLDALNIARAKSEFTDVAEKKIQNAVFHLNATEEDLIHAVIPEDIKPATDAMYTQTRNLRNFLRQDTSGLELATMIPKEEFEKARDNLEAAYNVTDEMIKKGYELAKLEMKIRREASI